MSLFVCVKVRSLTYVWTVCVCVTYLQARKEFQRRSKPVFSELPYFLGKNFQKGDFQGILGIWERRKDHFGAATVPVAGDRVFLAFLPGWYSFPCWVVEPETLEVALEFGFLHIAK